jgi:hypothetical protein
VHCITVKGLKLTFGIREVIGFRGTPLWLRVWLRSVINLVIVELCNIDSCGEKKW